MPAWEGWSQREERFLLAQPGNLSSTNCIEMLCTCLKGRDSPRIEGKAIGLESLMAAVPSQTKHGAGKTLLMPSDGPALQIISMRCTRCLMMVLDSRTVPLSSATISTTNTTSDAPYVGQAFEGSMALNQQCWEKMPRNSCTVPACDVYNCKCTQQGVQCCLSQPGLWVVEGSLMCLSKNSPLELVLVACWVQIAVWGPQNQRYSGDQHPPCAVHEQHPANPQQSLFTMPQRTFPGMTCRPGKP